MKSDVRICAPVSALALATVVLTPLAIESRAAEPTPIISRHVLFGNPDRASVQISPDGKQLSYLAATNGVLNVWVGPADNPDAAKAVTKDTYRGIRSYFWAYTSNHIIYM